MTRGTSRSRCARRTTGRGGSAYIHNVITPGAEIRIRGPKNHFQLDQGAEHYLLIAGGIGITAIIAMADRLKRAGKDYVIHYAGRSLAGMAFLDRLKRDHGDRLQLYPALEGRRLDAAAVISASTPETQVYACGPERLLSALEAIMRDQPARLHVEHFSAASTRLDPENEKSFDVELRDSGLSVLVGPDQTLLQALHAIGIDVPCDCQEGLCGSCEVGVFAGDIDHRDKVLSTAERAENTRMMACCSRARDNKLVLAL